MAYRVTGISALGLSLNWEKVDGDKQIAQRLIVFLEDRRVLFTSAQRIETAKYCVRSANATREHITELLSQDKLGRSLAESLRAIRTAFRRFVEDAGPDGRNFEGPHGPVEPFSAALGSLRTQVGLHIALISYYYGVDVEEELASILPPLDAEDLKWF